MDAELKAKWVAALRGGQYQQGRRNLRNDDGTFCCLGVLADIHSPDKWNASDPTGSTRWRHGYSGAYCRLVEEAGQITEPQMESLSTMNDDGKSFAEIAAYIEANL